MARYHKFYIHSSVEGHLGSFQLLAVINKAAMNMVEDPYYRCVLVVGWNIFWVQAQEWYSWYLRRNNFQSGCTRLQPHQQWRSVPLSPHLCQDLLSPEFLILSIPTGVRWNLGVVLICISLVTKDI